MLNHLVINIFNMIFFSPFFLLRRSILYLFFIYFCSFCYFYNIEFYKGEETRLVCGDRLRSALSLAIYYGQNVRR